MWASIFFASTVGLCFACLIGCIFTVQRARDAQGSLLRRLRSCESTLQLTQQSVEELTAIVNSVAQQQKMSRVRKATTHAIGSSSEPDPIREPEQWRAWMNAQIRNPQRAQ